jgi:hypothetical protein
MRPSTGRPRRARYEAEVVNGGSPRSSRWGERVDRRAGEQASRGVAVTAVAAVAAEGEEEQARHVIRAALPARTGVVLLVSS